jgi:hypothetical protein
MNHASPSNQARFESQSDDAAHVRGQSGNCLRVYDVACLTSVVRFAS